MKHLSIILCFILSLSGQNKAGSEYLLKTGDRLKITIYGAVRAEREVTINARGKITFLLAGTLMAAGKSIPQLRNELQNAASAKRKHVTISVVPLSFGSQNYTISGEVKYPGRKTLNGKTSLLQAIAVAGGFKSGEFRNSTVDLADLKHAFITRDNKHLNIDFHSLIMKGATKHNLVLKDGDYIHIPSALSRQIYTLGELRFPRKINYLNSVTVLQAIAESRGLTTDASNIIIILRGSLVAPKKFQLNVTDILDGKQPDAVLKPGDILYVPKKNSLTKDLAATAVKAFIRTVSAKAADKSTEFLLDERRIESDSRGDKNEKN